MYKAVVPNPPITISQTARAAHLVLTGYGHWLPNDPRGSGSEEIRKLGLAVQGEIHLGRKKVQPPRSELRAFYRAAEPLLEHEVRWFDDASRNAIGAAVGQCAKSQGYTIWACAVLRNHMHLVIRTHRDNALTMITRIANATHDALHQAQLVPEGHPVWSSRPYKVFLRTTREILTRIRYVRENPMKERLPAQDWDFVSAFNLK